ncbi:hypothetical protein GDO81_005257 [Engystomops pustulosus]|uniref:Regulator of cell cycle RGCC n=1 Tax=Engystomops pustulosus TaxID=76066 RepID=A0AAV7CMT5_ENGPU|nr:hypothetical protein GDO81_005257 [Engystomops pustulosus]
MKSPKVKSSRKGSFIEDDDLNEVLCEFDAVLEDFSSPFNKRRFRYDEHLQTMKRRSSTSISDSGISDSESEHLTFTCNWVKSKGGDGPRTQCT